MGYVFKEHLASEQIRQASKMLIRTHKVVQSFIQKNDSHDKIHDYLQKISIAFINK